MCKQKQKQKNRITKRKAKDKRQKTKGKTKDKRQKTKDKRQKTKDKRQKTKDKRQKTKDKRQKKNKEKIEGRKKERKKPRSFTPIHYDGAVLPRSFDKNLFFSSTGANYTVSRGGDFPFSAWVSWGMDQNSFLGMDPEFADPESTINFILCFDFM